MVPSTRLITYRQTVVRVNPLRHVAINVSQRSVEHVDKLIHCDVLDRFVPIDIAEVFPYVFRHLSARRLLPLNTSLFILRKRFPDIDQYIFAFRGRIHDGQRNRHISRT